MSQDWKCCPICDQMFKGYSWERLCTKCDPALKPKPARIMPTPEEVDAFSLEVEAELIRIRRANDRKGG